MSKIELKSEGRDCKLKIDDIPLDGIVTGLTLYIRPPGYINRFCMEGTIYSCDVSAEGIVSFNGTEVPDEIAREHYYKLREKFDNGNVNNE